MSFLCIINREDKHNVLHMLQSADETLLVIVYKGPAKSVSFLSLNTAGGVYWLSWLAGWASPTVWAAATYRLDTGEGNIGYYRMIL